MAKSKPEETLAYHLKLARINFEREVLFVPGRKYRADFLLPYNLLVEVDGGLHLPYGGHTGKKAIVRDMMKTNLATLHGFRLLRFDPDAIYSGSALAFIQDVLIKLRHDASKEAER